jgi:hypothetical protein
LSTSSSMAWLMVRGVGVYSLEIRMIILCVFGVQT